jgi:uncharacterized membrane protein YccC
MTPPDFDLLDFIKTFIWAPALALAAWAWSRNEKEHDMIRESHEKLSTKTSDYVDSALGEFKDEQRRRSDKLANHIEKLFSNAELDRKEFSKVMADHREDSYKRHIELLHAINAKADKQ